MTYKSTINRTTELMLPLFGLWHNTTWWILLSRLFCFILLMGHQSFVYLYFRTHFSFEYLYDLMDCLSSFLAIIKVVIKLIILWLNQQKFIEALTMMAEDWTEYTNSDFGLREMTRKAKLSARICNTIIIFHTIAVFAYISSTLQAKVNFADRTIELPLMMKTQYPFNIYTQHIYRLVLVMQTMCIMITSWGAALINILLFTLTLHAAGQIEIMRYWLTELVPKEKMIESRGNVQITNKIIQKHQRIIIFVGHIDSMFSYIALLQLVSNTLIICTLGFVIVTALDGDDAIEWILRFFLFYAITNFEAFTFCFAGEYLNNKSKAIGMAAYNSAWYDLKPREIRNLLLIILRTQRPLTVTVGKFVDLTLECYTSIMKISGSYLSVLLAIQYG